MGQGEASQLEDRGERMRSHFPGTIFLLILFTFFVVVIFSHHFSGRHFLLRNYKLRGKFLVFHYDFGIRLLAERMRPHIPETIFL